MRGGLIESYVEQMMPDLYGAFWMRRRIKQEITEHLSESVDRLQMRGLTRTEAEARAVEQFGAPSLVAREFAQMKGIGVPTNFTRWSGIALILGVVTIAVALAWQAVSTSFEHSAFGPMAMSGLVLFAVGLIGIYVRLRGQMGRTARIGSRLLLIGFPGALLSSAFWFGPGALFGMALAITGAAIYFVEMYRSGILPRGAAGLVIIGFAGALIVGLAGMYLDFDGNAAAAAGQAITVAGFVWIGIHLWSEQPSQEESFSGSAIA
jgi:hypothetical protein